MNILIIEDQPAFSIGLSAILKSAFAIKSIESENYLNQGLERLIDEKERFDLIFIGFNKLDVDTLNALSHITNSLSGLPIIILSAIENLEQSSLIKDMGFNHIISKDINQEDLLKLIKTALLNNVSKAINVDDAANSHETNKGAITAKKFSLKSKNMTRTLNKSTNRRLIKDNKSLEKTHFEFRVSADEEHTFLTATRQQTAFDFGERVHHYLLLILARKRQEDEQQGIAESSQGWIENSDLQNMLGLDYCHLNTLIFRARQQINKALSDAHCSVDIVQRRLGAIRFSGKSFQITRAGKLESYYRMDHLSTPDYPLAVGSHSF